MQAPHLRRTIRLYVLAAAIAATVALCVAAWDYSWGIVSPKLLNAVLTILLVGLVAELGAVSLNIGSASFSVAFIPYLAATYLFPTIWAMLVAAVAECAVETFVRKKPLIKIVFNTSKEVLALGLASSVYQLLGGIPTIEPTQFRILPGAILGASLTFGLIDSLGVGYAVALSERLNFTQVWSRMYGGHVLYDLFAAPIPAFLAYLYVRYELLGLISLVLPLFVVRHIYKMNLQLEQANRDLLELMVKNIEARDPYTSGHSQRVAQYARVIAKEAAVSFWHVEQIVARPTQSTRRFSRRKGGSRQKRRSCFSLTRSEVLSWSTQYRASEALWRTLLGTITRTTTAAGIRTVSLVKRFLSVLG